MYLHTLTLRAIGPYAGEHTIDFAALGASGLFLLEGPTGSGKSTVIDAVVFALYGGLASEQSSHDRLRSHHAAPDVEPFVELVFETGAGVHRIRRTPKWSRPKKNRSGVTTANATAKLIRLSSPDALDGEVVSTSTQEVGTEIPRLLGLTRQQFVQTVVLPQGEFAEFLRSTGEQRRLVLQSLFGTEIYERTTEQLVDGRKTANAAIAVAEAGVRDAIARLREAAGDDDVDESTADAVLEAVTEGARVASALHLTAQTHRASCAAARDAKALWHRAVVRRAALLERRRDLDARREGVDEARERLAAALRAAAVEGAVAGTEKAATRARAAALDLAAEVERVRADQPDLASDLEGAAPSDSARSGFDATVVRDRHESAAADLARLAESARVEAGLPAREGRLDDTEAKLVDDRAEVQRLEDELAERPTQRAALITHRDERRTAAESVPEAERLVDERVRVLARLDDLVTLDAAVDAAAADIERSARQALAAVEAETALRRRKILGMAGELAAGLVAGEPCAVCGSLEHPAPAMPTHDHPTDDDIDAAAELRQQAETRASAEGRTHAAVVERRDAARAELGDSTRVDVESQLAEARLRLAAARSSVAELATADAELARQDDETEALRLRLESRRVAVATADARLESDRVALAADRDRVAEVRGDRAESVAALVAVLTAEADALARLERVLAADEHSATDLALRTAERDAALAEQSFADVAAVAASALPEPERREIAAAVRAFDRDIDVVAAGLAEADIVAAGHPAPAAEPGHSAEPDAEPDAKPDLASEPDPEAARAELEAAEAALTVADDSLREASGAEARASERARRTLAAHAALTAALAVGDAAVERARAAVRMADLASASSAVNTKGVTLGTYVLLRRFDDVVAAANVRLTVMSNGRYALQASDERESGSRSRKTGLALAIRDHTTDTVRDPKSFSGGETFYASLSLALGLADVVQAEAGGLDLGTLFVDEGFGTLDPETLDAVMTELGRLSAAGRVVGIVSHVDELKQRIADRLEVRRQPDGSSTLRSTV
ncbi:AAA family ATPase [Frigoribacterium sp. 2-23]|uniref:AAA family ATPase n=1 Tax=Frigoribacterium sp. 2-23 TaxID=3415006 RepID=UPI003C6F40D6